MNENYCKSYEFEQQKFSLSKRKKKKTKNIFHIDMYASPCFSLHTQTPTHIYCEKSFEPAIHLRTEILTGEAKMKKKKLWRKKKLEIFPRCMRIACNNVWQKR